MESFFSRYKNALVLTLVLLAQVVLLAMQVRRPAPDLPDGHNVRLWRYWVASVVTPPERLVHNAGRSVRGVWTNYLFLRNLREQNQGLQAENDRLRLEQASLAEDAREGQRLRAMLDFRAQYIDKTVPAQVIGTSGTDQAHVIYIDKGYKDGVLAQMPVITPDGVVGKVKNSFPHTAQVLLISDQTSGAGVMLQTTRIRGVLKGDASGQPQMINISPDDRIKPGEPVLTSGGDQVYPKGLPVGTVEEVVPDPETSYVNVLVTPNANLAKLEEVMVITATADKMPFAQEKDLMQSEVDALAEKQRAADILSEKLPSLRDPDAPEIAAATGDAATTAAGGDPARPLRPPSALHPDRYTPGAAPPATGLTPGQAPAGVHRMLSDETGTPAASRPRSTASVEGTISTGSTAVQSRFPTKALPKPAGAETGATATGTGSLAKTVPRIGTVTPGTVATGAGSGRTVAAATGSAVVARPRSAVSGGSGLALPLQPADSTTPRRTAATTGTAAAARTTAAGDGTNATGAARVARPVGFSPTSAGTVSSTVPPTPRVVTGTGAPSAPGVAAPNRAMQPGTSIPRRTAIPSGSGGDGILAPAGMGLGATSAPRPRPASPAASGVPRAAGTSPGTPASAGNRPATRANLPAGGAAGATTAAKPAVPRTQPASGQVTTKPKTPVAAKPKPQPAQTSPPGGQ
jgi:rod shape-determining protein MreC